MATRHLPPVEFLRECFSYDACTGIVRWRRRPDSHFDSYVAHRVWNTKYADQTGAKDERYGAMFRLNWGGEVYHLKAHRLAWALHHGISEFGELDHANGDGHDNRIANLRLASRSQNNANRTGFSRTGLPKGVTQVGNRFQASAAAGDGRTKYLGRFGTAGEAHAAYAAFAHQRHGEFFNPG